MNDNSKVVTVYVRVTRQTPEELLMLEARDVATDAVRDGLEHVAANYIGNPEYKYEVVK